MITKTSPPDRPHVCGFTFLVGAKLLDGLDPLPWWGGSWWREKIGKHTHTQRHVSHIYKK